MAAVAADACGVDAVAALEAMESVEEVAGRFSVRSFGEVRARLMLAKNPAGWDELLDLVAGSDGPLVVSINARVADGADPSWLWDVPYERLAGRSVVATGDRFRDLSVRLHYAGVAHTAEPDPILAVRIAAGDTGGVVDVIGNYTAFHDLLGAACVSGPLRCGGRVPRPARHLRRRRQRADPGAARRLAGTGRRAPAGGLGRPAARRRHLLPGRRRGRSPGARGPHADRRRDLGQAGRRRCSGPGRLRRLPDRRADLPRRRRRPARRPRPPGHRHRQGHRAAGGGGGVGGPDRRERACRP